MKTKIITILSALMLMISLVVPTYADGNYSISEVKNEDGTISRTYIKNETERVAISKYDIKIILSNLGMEDDFIEKLSDEDLREYAEAAKIVGTVAYTTTDSNGNKRIISEAEALKQVEKYDLNRSSREHDTYEDDYMRVFHLVSQSSYNPERFKFSTDARWLKMPFFRKTDSIGSCAQYMACDDDSASGWYEYDKDEWSLHGSSSISRPREELSSSDFSGANDGTYSGLAAKFDLPRDVISEYYYVLCSDFKIHVEHYADINEPDQTINFASNGTYDHLRYKLGFSPSISIGTDGPGASIGLNVTGKTDKRTTGVVVRYEP